MRSPSDLNISYDWQVPVPCQLLSEIEKFRKVREGLKKKYRKAGYVQRRVQKDERGIFFRGVIKKLGEGANYFGKSECGITKSNKNKTQ